MRGAYIGGRSWGLFLERWCVAALVLLSSCASRPPGRFVVDQLEITGVNQVDGDETEDRLATRAGSTFFGFPLDYEVYDPFVVERDIRRIERYYRAKGFYEARVMAGQVTSSKPGHVRVQVIVHEGPPTLVSMVRIERKTMPSKEATLALAVAQSIQIGDRFEEDVYHEMRRRILKALTDNGHAHVSIEGGFVEADLTPDGGHPVLLNPAEEPHMPPKLLPLPGSAPVDSEEHQEPAPIGTPDSTFDSTFSTKRYAVRIDGVRHTADIFLMVDPGAVCQFGDIRLEGLEGLPEERIRSTIGITKGDLYSTSELESARHALLDLGVFSSVEYTTDTNDKSQVILPVTFRLTPSPLHTLTLGGGVQADVLQTDVHGLVGFEQNNFLGGLRKLTMQARPGAVLFPSNLQNLLPPRRLLPEVRSRAELRQPSFLEARTNGTLRTEFLVYPFLLPARSVSEVPDVVVGYREVREAAGLDRKFFNGHLGLSSSYNIQLSYPFAYFGFLGRGIRPVSISYLSLIQTVDLRDDPLRPRRGAFLTNELQIAGGVLKGDANDVKIQPDMRFYAPVSKRLTIAARASVGFLFPRSYGNTLSQSLPDSATNPSEALSFEESRNRDLQILFFRAFFSGGPNSNRGYAPRGVGPRGIAPFNVGRSTALRDCIGRAVGGGGVAGSSAFLAQLPPINPELCAIPLGGLSLWESSLELRVQITQQLSMVVFLDGSDVTRDRLTLRFNFPHLSTGIGVHYDTPVGPVRFDLGYAIPGLQHVGGTLDPNTEGQPATVLGVPIAPNIAVGEAFLMPPSRRSLRIAHVILGTAVTGSLFLVSFTVSVVAHGDIAATRRLGADITTRVLANVFLGRVEIDDIDHIGFDGVDVGQAEVWDPHDHRVLAVHGLHARIPLLRLAKELLTSHGEKILRFDSAWVDNVDVLIDKEDETGLIGIADAFTPKPSPPQEPSGPPGQPIRVEFPTILVRRAWAHGNPDGSIPIDADLIRMEASLVAGAQGVTLDVARFQTVTHSFAPYNPYGTLEYHLRVRPDPEPIAMWAAFHGNIGRVSVAAEAHLNGTKVVGAMEAGSITPEAFHSLFPTVPLYEEGALRVVVSGSLPDLAVGGQVTLGPSHTLLDGSLHLVPAVQLSVDAHIRDLTPRIFVPDAPSANLSAEARLSVTLDEPNPVLAIIANTLPTTLGEQTIPAATIHAEVRSGGVYGNAQIHEPGAPTDAVFSIQPSGLIKIDANANITSFEAVPQLAHSLEGSSRVHVKAQLERGLLDASMEADLQDVGKGPVHVGSGNVHARVSGPLSDLRVNASLQSTQVHAVDMVIAEAEARATGSLMNPHITLEVHDPLWTTLHLESDIRTEHGVQFSDLQAGFQKGDLNTTANVTSVTLEGGNIALRGLHLNSTSGSLQGDVTLGAQRLKADLEGSLDLAKLGRTFPSLHITHGTLTLAAHMDARNRKAEGSLDIKANNIEANIPWRQSTQNNIVIPLFGDIEAHAQVHNEAIATNLQGHLSVPGNDQQHILQWQGAAHGTLAGPLAEARSWSGITGNANLNDVVINLDTIFQSELAKVVLPHYRSIPILGGQVHLSATAERPLATSLPAITTILQTKDISIQTPSDQTSTSVRLGKRWRGIDILASLSAFPEAPENAEKSRKKKPDRTTLAIGVRLNDSSGELASASANATVNRADFIRDIALALGPEGAAMQTAQKHLFAIPLTAQLDWPERSLENWPSAIRPDGLTGKVAANMEASGFLQNLDVRFHARTKDFAALTPGVTPFPVDGVLAGHMGKGRADLWGKLLHDKTEVAEMAFTANVDSSEMLSGNRQATPWNAGGLVVLRGLQLEAIPQLAERGITGRISGTLSASGLHQKPEAQVDLRLLHGSYLGSELPTGNLRGRLAEGASFVTLALQQGASATAPQGGMLKATALLGLKFQNKIFPAFDSTQPQTLAVLFQRFDINPFSTLTTPVLAQLGGHLDGEVSINVGAQSLSSAPGAEHPHLTGISGGLRWSDGVMLIPQIGQTFTKGYFQLTTAARGDDILLSVRDLSLAATTGRVHGWADLTFATDRLLPTVFGNPSSPPRGTEKSPDIRDMITARAAMWIPESEKIPLTFEGVSVGNAYGTAEAQIHANRSMVDTAVAIPDLQLELPESETRGVQDLSADPDVGVMDREFRIAKNNRAHTAIPIKIRIGVGSSLEGLLHGAPERGAVTVRRSGLNVRVRGKPVIDITDETHITGTVETMGGRVLALGKPFEVEPGFIRFEGETSNPYLRLRARWDAPDNTRVYADVTGYLNDPDKIHLRSDPPRPEAEVLSLVLFGRDPQASAALGSDQNITTQNQSTAGGLAVGGGVASTMLNSLLDPVHVFGRRIETRVDTSSSVDTKIGVATQIRPNLWAQVDASTMRQPQQYQYTDTYWATLDWRFRRHWSLRTTVGDRGSSILDLLWQHRY